MDVNNTMEQNISALFSNIESFTQEEGTLGKPLSVENKTLVPVISVSIGYGGGNSSGKLTQDTASTSKGAANTGMDALGLGARISTDAILIVDQGNVSTISINSPTSGAVSQLVNKLPQMMGMGQNVQQQGQQQGQQQSQQQQGQQQGQQQNK
ncbi:hypothetical protein CACET_c30700 [Clostridium aceticum]|uniref:Uncharacterized protein n=1 Tax=Clostridium aceticum TaxID=84022 RepID=A0A0D8IDN8_9CLOT|nr:GerW family sporulation protein [Clostridium aceticum]AKL96514.1 hypothetical protein CACET_c30700 [Clostridium aceticum]KJF27316.1 hypothetical protein TZ02_08235 [Clostridium aceticum]